MKTYRLEIKRIKLTNILTLTNNVQLGDLINGAKGRNNYRTIKQMLNTKRLACHNYQRGLDDTARIEKVYSPPTAA